MSCNTAKNARKSSSKKKVSRTLLPEEVINVISKTCNKTYSSEQLNEFASKLIISNDAPPLLLNKIFGIWVSIINGILDEKDRIYFMQDSKDKIETEGLCFLRVEYDYNEAKRRAKEELKPFEERLTPAEEKLVYFEDLVYNKGWRAVPPEQQVLPKQALKDNEFHGYHVINPGNSSKKS